MLAGTLFLPGTDIASPRARGRFLAVLGAGLLAAGFVLRPLHGFSKINGTESYCLATAGISALVLLLFYLGLDVLKGAKAAAFLRPAGRNPLPGLPAAGAHRERGGPPRRPARRRTSAGSSGLSTERAGSRGCSTRPS